MRWKKVCYVLMQETFCPQVSADGRKQRRAATDPLQCEGSDSLLGAAVAICGPSQFTCDPSPEPERREMRPFVASFRFQD